MSEGKEKSGESTKVTKGTKAGKKAELKLERLVLADLKLHPRNDEIRNHPEEGSPSWRVMVKSLEDDYYEPIVWNERNGFLVSGHLRWKVMTAEGYTEADVVVVDYDEPKHIARMLSANKSQGQRNIAGEFGFLQELQIEGLDLSLAGFHLDELDNLSLSSEDYEHGEYSDEFSSDSDDGADGSDSMYTDKITIPTYEPTEEHSPEISEVVDLTKTEELIASIEESSVPDEVKEFLKVSAYRHTIFTYSKIAEYYAHASKEVQELMEASALVIVDFDKAIEGGFLQLSKEAMAQYSEQESEIS